MCIFADPFHSTGAALKPQQGSVQDSEQMLSERHVRIARKSRAMNPGYCRQALWSTVHRERVEACVVGDLCYEAKRRDGRRTRRLSVMINRLNDDIELDR
jgi:hypothetical protein